MAQKKTTTSTDVMEVPTFTQVSQAVALVNKRFAPLIQMAKGGELAIDEPTEKALEVLRAEYGDLSSIDAATPEGYEFLKNGIKRLTGYRTGVASQHKELKDPFLQIGRVLDSTKNAVTAELEALEKPMKAKKKEQDDAEERARLERIARLEAKIEREITALAVEARSATSEQIGELMDRLAQLDPEQDFFDRTKEACKAHHETMAELERLFTEKLAFEQAEAAREEEAAKRRELEAKARIDDAINRLKSAPLELFNGTAADVAAAITKFDVEIKPAAFGDRYDEAVQAQKAALMQLKQMHEMKLAMETMQTKAEVTDTLMGVATATASPEPATEFEPETLQEAVDGLAQHIADTVPAEPAPAVEAPKFAPPVEKVSITKTEYARLLERDLFLSALEAAGVDNWDGYAHAQEIMSGWEPEEDVA